MEDKIQTATSGFSQGCDDTVETFFHSTRSCAESVTGKFAIRTGIAPDGGLYVRDDLADKPLDLAKVCGQSFQEPALEVLPLGFGRSAFRYAVPAGSGLTPESLGGRRVACSYRNIVERDLRRRGVEATVVKVDGAVEISIRLGVADAVADVVESGQTLRAAGLEVVGEPVMQSEAIVVARDAATAALPQAVTFLHRLKGIVVGRAYEMLEYDIPRAALEQAVVLTPGIESPTVAPLSDPDWVAVKALCLRKGINETMDQLERIGARGIVAAPIRAARI